MPKALPLKDKFCEPSQTWISQCETEQDKSFLLRANSGEVESKFEIGDSIACKLGKEFIGRSKALKGVLKQIEIVAPTDASVLILGETGTGKELVARAIHNISGRCKRTLARVNCAAIPSGLLESELFGHEKGSFTGAIARRIGRFELADQGSLFLDEIGDFPVDLQPKLLRVLQEKEFERVGSNQTQPVNVRLIAATSRNLSQMVAERQFRGDLFYRLNVFPIRIPPLRERSSDIPILVWHFIEEFSGKMNKRIKFVSTEVMAALKSYHWPGNIRELQNFIERAVILSPDKTLQAPLNDLDPSASFGTNDDTGNGGVSRTATLQESERGHIMKALAQTRWLVGGPHGAAALLRVNRTTLLSRMQKLGISRRARA